MNLQEFIKASLVEIVNGVSEARDEAQATGASIGSMQLFGYLREAKVVFDENDRQITNVEFDIALADSSGSGSKGGIGVFLGTVGVGTQGESHGERSSHSRVKFSVPVVLPPKAG